MYIENSLGQDINKSEDDYWYNLLYISELMGQQAPKKQEPQKTLKEQVDEYSKEISAMRRQYAREKYKLEFEGKKLDRELKKKIKNKQSAQSKKVIAQQILKNNQMVQKYNNLDNQLQNVNFELKQMAVNESMQNVMAGMAKIMSGASNKMKGMGHEETIKRFMQEKQRMNVLNEYVEDVMNQDEEEIEDEDVDKLIGQMTNEVAAKKVKKIEMEMDDLDNYENQIKDL